MLSNDTKPLFIYISPWFPTGLLVYEFDNWDVNSALVHVVIIHIMSCMSYPVCNVLYFISCMACPVCHDLYVMSFISCLYVMSGILCPLCHIWMSYLYAIPCIAYLYVMSCISYNVLYLYSMLPIYACFFLLCAVLYVNILHVLYLMSYMSHVQYDAMYRSFTRL